MKQVTEGGGDLQASSEEAERQKETEGTVPDAHASACDRPHLAAELLAA